MRKRKTGEPKTMTYAFDFDGVIASYNGFRGHEHESEPIAEVVKAIRMLKKNGNTVIIYSTRGKDFLKNYCRKNNIPVDYFNENPTYRQPNSGKPIAKVYVDDRAFCYRGQKAQDLVRELKSFKTYWEEKRA